MLLSFLVSMRESLVLLHKNKKCTEQHLKSTFVGPVPLLFAIWNVY